MFLLKGLSGARIANIFAKKKKQWLRISIVAICIEQLQIIGSVQTGNGRKVGE